MAKTIARGVYLIGWLSLLGSLTLALGVGGGFIRISQPKPGARLSGKVTVRAQAYGIQGLSYVIFGVDAEKPHSTNAEPYQYELDTTAMPDGPHSLFAEAHGRYGLLATSAPVQVIVANPSSVSPRVLTRAPEGQPQPDAAARAGVQQPALVSGGPVTPIAALAKPAAQPVAKPSAEPVAKPTPVPTMPAQVIPVLPTVAAESADPKSEDSAAAPGYDFLALAAPKARIPAAAPRAPKGSAPEGKVVSLQPIMMAGRAFVRFRSMAEGLGHKVAWLHEEKTGVATNGKARIEVTASSSAALRVTLKGHPPVRDPEKGGPSGSLFEGQGGPERAALSNGQSFDMGAAACIYEDRLVAPSRPCAEMLGAQVAWDEKSRMVRISFTPEYPPQVAAR